MADVQSLTINLENRGLMISRPGDVLPEGYLTSSLNLTSNKTGSIQSRGGSARVNVINLGGPVHSQGRIITGSGAAYRYQGAGTSLYREWTQIATGLSGNQLTFREGGPDESILPQEIVFDSNARYKDNGALTTGFGIAGPMAAASAVAAAATTKTIDLFEYATNLAIQNAWTAATATVTTSSTNPAQGSFAGNIAIAAGATGTITASAASVTPFAPINLNQFAIAGDSDDNDWIVLYVRVDKPQYIIEVRVMFDVDPATNDFTQNFYWKAFTANILAPAATSTSTASTATQDLASNVPVRLSGVDNQDPRFQQIPPDELATGANQWLQLFVKKNEFTRVGTHVNNWGNVAAVRIQVTAGAGSGVNVGVDGLIMQGSTTGRLDGTDYLWIYRYENENTGTTSPFSPDMVPAANTTGTTIQATKATVTVRNPRDTQATHIQLYRFGGANTAYLLSIRQAVTAWTGTTTITDGVPDQDLGDVADFTQIELANLLQTPSQTCTSCGKTVNNGGAFTDYTANVSDDNGGTYADLSSLGTLNNNWLVIGADQQFRQILIAMDGNVNTNASVLTVQYWDGAVWRAVINQIDGTAVSGKTLAQPGTIQFELPQNWATNTANGLSAFYIRLTFGSALSGAVHITEVRLSANAFNPTTCEVHAGRVWTDDTQHTDRIWYSNRFAIETFADTNFIVASTGGDPVVKPYGLDDQLFAFTRKTVNRIIGSTAQSFDQIPTGSEEGLFGEAICRGRGRIFYRAYGGIYALPASGYATKVSMQIDGLFHGFGSEDGSMAPIDQTKAATETMEFFDAKVWFNYTDINGTRLEITLDLDTERWEPTDRPSTSYLRLDDVSQFYSGASDGLVYQRYTSNQDQGVNIALRLGTSYVDFGNATETKQLVAVQIDGDTQGAAMTFQVQGDNGQGFFQTRQLSSAGRNIMSFNFDDETFARNVRVLLNSQNAGALVKFYKITFFYIPLVSPLTKLVTDWDDLGYPGDKRLRQMQLEIDTIDTPATILVQTNDPTNNQIITAQTLTVQAATRQIVPFSLAADLLAKLVRLNITSAAGFRYYKHQFEFLRDPLQTTRYDTYELDFGYTRWKYIRRVWVAGNTPAIVTMDVYVDQALRHSRTFELTSGSGWAKIQLKMPAALKGMLFRFVFTTTTGCKIFLDQSDVEWRPLAEPRGYHRAQLQRTA
jgi:hypothetical protein